ncbi:30S ribosome-binding factor RbfA [Candidatus Kryptobacter tengchongensis]|uniref:Ribosome-binding factor A n=1 Tax=Kryptobacter tengchongensis TaxID=1643429 RepID=A0A916LK05_KRYT1|nr:30S ribosome-binding factor RbfA [Candidatus Kryptobacter tengchongensis]CUT00695.1 ribosome-binding factor A [Candidatus Kryptobacter tengchongensis]
MNSIRAERVASLIKEEVSDIITKVLEHENVGFWTVTNVRMSPDLRYAKIYISIYGDKITQQNTIRKIESLKKNIRHRLGSRLRLRFIPEIEFYLDDTLEHVDRINALLKQIEDREKNDKKSDDSGAEDKTG